jgi:hypothetical protein
MAYASGYITVETEIDINDYDSEFEIEFEDLDDVIDTARANGYSREEIIEHCFDHGTIDPSKFMQKYMTVDEISQLFQESVVHQIDLLSLTVSNQSDKIKELEEQLANATKTDEELVKDVAY